MQIAIQKLLYPRFVLITRNSLQSVQKEKPIRIAITAKLTILSCSSCVVVSDTFVLGGDVSTLTVALSRDMLCTCFLFGFFQLG